MMTCHCESLPGSFDECRLSAGWPPTLRPNQPIWAMSPPKDWLLPSADIIAIYYYYYSARKLILILPSQEPTKPLIFFCQVALCAGLARVCVTDKNNLKDRGKNRPADIRCMALKSKSNETNKLSCHIAYITCALNGS